MSSNGQGHDDPYHSSSWSGYSQPGSWNSTPRYTPSVSSYASSSSASQVSGSSYGSQSHYTHSAGGLMPYDEFGMPQAYSDTPAPSQYSAISTFHQGIVQQQIAPPPSNNMLYCEFQPWTGCREQFRLDDVDSWIRHTEDIHLRGAYPAVCVCWFCDDICFMMHIDSNKDDPTSASSNTCIIITGSLLRASNKPLVPVKALVLRMCIHQVGGRPEKRQT